MTGRDRAAQPADSAVAADRDAALLEALLGYATDMMSVIDAHGVLRCHFPRGSLGYEIGENLGTTVLDFMDPDERPAALERLTRVLATAGGRESLECQIRAADGSWRWMEVTATNLVEDPLIAGVVLNSRDVTERHQAQEAQRLSEEWLRSLVQHGRDLIAVVDARSRLLYMSPSSEQVLGAPAGEVTGRRAFEYVHRDDRAKLRAVFTEVLGEEGHQAADEFRYRHGDGSWRWLDVTLTNHLENPAVRGVVLNFRDVTERRRVEEARRDSEERFRSAFEHAPIGMALADRHGRIFRSNRALARMLGRQADEMVGMAIRDITHPEDRDTNADQMHRLFDGEMDSYQLEKRYLHSDGHTVWAALSVSAVQDADGKPWYMIGQIEDITERKATRERLAHEVGHDSLTGIPNRVAFLDRLRATLECSTRRRHRVGVLFVDLDNFKLVNDSFGHEAGDQLLIIIAERLRHALRPGDTVARFGGDEFSIICPSVTKSPAAMDLAQRLLGEVARPIPLPQGEVFVTASVGIALSGGAGESPETLLRDADTAMYRAKHQGRAQAAFCDDRVRARNLEHVQIANALHHALERHEFEVHYQPLIELETGNLAGFEALLRWQHPERGLVKPFEFIGLAEETGLIVPIGAWVLHQACGQLAHWHSQSPDRRLTMSVNLSPRQLGEPTVANHVADVLKHTGVPPEAVWLEITETTIMYDTESAVSALRALRTQGVHLSVDDFGTGYSSLSHLKRLPIEALKIDQTFVEGLGRDPDDSAIVAGVISLAHALGLSATAEGVETPLQLAHLRTLGCDLAQGNLLALPQPAGTLTDTPATLLDGWAALAHDQT